MTKTVARQAEQKTKRLSARNAELKLFIDLCSNADEFEAQTFVNLCENTNEETVLKILAHFNENLKATLLSVETAKKTEKNEIVFKSAHKISGSAELLGFKRFAHDTRILSNQMKKNIHIDSCSSEILLYIYELQKLSGKIERSFPKIMSFL